MCIWHDFKVICTCSWFTQYIYLVHKAPLKEEFFVLDFYRQKLPHTQLNFCCIHMHYGHLYMYKKCTRGWPLLAVVTARGSNIINDVADYK